MFYLAAIVLIVLLVVSAFFSGSETVLFSLTSHDRLRLKQSGKRLDVMAAGLLDDSRSLITTLMIGNLGCNILIFVISTQLLVELQTRVGTGITAVFALLPSLVVTYVSDVLPKVVGCLNNMKLAPYLALPLTTLVRVAKPVCRVVDRGILQPVHRVVSPSQTSVTAFSTVDLAEMLEMSREQGVIDMSENDLLQEVVRIGELRVRDVMTPRVDVVAYDLKDPPEKLQKLLRQSHLAKLPVYEGQIDNLVGLVYAKDVFLVVSSSGSGGGAAGGDKISTAEIRKLIRPLQYVPEFQTLDRLIARFRQTRTQLGAVVDEYGGFVGIVTLEDVVEQMVGDIYEPHDVPQQMVERLASDEYRVAGELSIVDWEEAFDISAKRLAELHHRASTLAGLLATLLNRIPKVGDQVQLGHLLMQVESMQGRRVEYVRLKLIDHHTLSVTAGTVVGQAAHPAKPGVGNVGGDK